MYALHFANVSISGENLVALSVFTKDLNAKATPKKDNYHHLNIEKFKSLFSLYLETNWLKIKHEYQEKIDLLSKHMRALFGITSNQTQGNFTLCKLDTL